MNGKFLINTNLIKKSFLYASIRPRFVSIYTVYKNDLNIDKNKPILNRIIYKNEFLPLSSFSTSQFRSEIRGGPGYTKYAHGRYKPKISTYAYFWISFLFGAIFIILFFDFENFILDGKEPEEKMEEIKKLYNRMAEPKAKEIEIQDIEVHDNDVEEKTLEIKKKNKASFRERKIIQYENKIRHYSTPDKVFRYFATLKVWNEKLNDYEIFMKPDDFIRSLTYGAKQPERLGLDSYNKFDPNSQKLELNLNEDSVFRHFSKHGLISFSDYIFLVTLLSSKILIFYIHFKI